LNSMHLMLWIELTRLEIICYKCPTQKHGRQIGMYNCCPIFFSCLNILHSQHVHGDIKEVVKPFDWSLTTDYKGTILPKQSPTESDQGLPSLAATTKQLPLALLSQPDPILFFSAIDLFEDELADNGMSLLTVKIRVMPQRLLLLCRFFLRLDGVIVRIRDTRVYIEFATGEVIREYTAREEKYDTVKTKLGNTDDAASIMRDADKLTKLCPVTELIVETLVLPVQGRATRLPATARLSGF